MTIYTDACQYIYMHVHLLQAFELLSCTLKSNYSTHRLCVCLLDRVVCWMPFTAFYWCPIHFLSEEITISVKRAMHGIASVTLTNDSGEPFGAAPVQNGLSSVHSTPSRCSTIASQAGSNYSSPHASAAASVHGSAATSIHGSATSSPARPVLYHIPAAQITPGKLFFGICI